MGLTIKNDEARRPAREPAELTGESVGDAVMAALRERLERERESHGRGISAARLLEIGRECAPRLPEPLRSTDHGDLLYGEDALPR